MCFRMTKAAVASPLAFFILGVVMACVGIWALAIDRTAFGFGMLVFAAGLLITGLIRMRAGRRPGR